MAPFCALTVRSWPSAATLCTHCPDGAAATAPTGLHRAAGLSMHVASKLPGCLLSSLANQVVKRHTEQLAVRGTPVVPLCRRPAYISSGRVHCLHTAICPAEHEAAPALQAALAVCQSRGLQGQAREPNCEPVSVRW